MSNDKVAVELNKIITRRWLKIVNSPRTDVIAKMKIFLKNTPFGEFFIKRDDVSTRRIHSFQPPTSNNFE